MSEKMIKFVSGEHFCIVDWHGVGGRFTRSDIPALISELQSLEGKPAEGSAPQTGEKRKRCGETGPRPFMVCGRWKGHEGHHRAMNDEYEWFNPSASPLPPSEARTPGWLNKQFKRAAEDVTVLEAALDHRKAEPSSPRPALRDYVQHKPGCAYLAWMRGVEYNEQPCSCGLAALLDAERGEGWQPIESGPKDGTPVLLWWPHHASRALIGVCHFEHWSSEGANGCQRVQPTHWMPLPKGPNHAA
jgi:hypothetical protein